MGAQPRKAADLHGNVSDSAWAALMLVDVINDLNFPGKGGASGDCEIARIAPHAAAGAIRPAPESSIARIVEAARPMATPVGLAATEEISLVPLSSA